MYQAGVPTQITFHYMNGQSESFNLNTPIESDGTDSTLQLEVRHILKKDWWILNLAEQTIFVNIDNVIKIEVKPSIANLRGEDVFTNAERVTAMTRSR
ncbi:hypothetical protein H6F67_04655 [Microcoleus sp. FACHB-1515]|uniref:hypothetical protein n=1 Tax=Cyanophyceae TaxID=3028117 RepID=UPI001683E8F8|nr:hypothetical protein [Microcoleus sp. FACHB-1515]MBD2089142.1 hypothetical protein [Microcoleus sp. FACHB-1515]